MSLIFKKVLGTFSFQKAFMSFGVTFLFVFSRFYAVSTVLVRKVIFLILVFNIFISFMYLNIYLKPFL